MGFSARYHAASLAAVFIALAVGILIGSEFGGKVISNARQGLEDSLTQNLNEERDRGDELSSQLDRANEFGERVYPGLVDGSLRGKKIGVLALGGLPEGTLSDIEAALEPTGAEITAVGVVRAPPNPDDFASSLSETKFSAVAQDQNLFGDLGIATGKQLVDGGRILNRVDGDLFSRVSGEFTNLDAVIVTRAQPDNLNGGEVAATQRLENGLIKGLSSTGVRVIGIEASDTDPSSITFFDGRGISSVDDVDLVAGRVAAVFALLGAEGSFGVKSTADRLLPDLLTPPKTAQPTKGG